MFTKARRIIILTIVACFLLIIAITGCSTTQGDYLIFMNEHGNKLSSLFFELEEKLEIWKKGKNNTSEVLGTAKEIQTEINKYFSFANEKTVPKEHRVSNEYYWLAMEDYYKAMDYFQETVLRDDNNALKSANEFMKGATELLKTSSEVFRQEKGN